MSKLTAIDRELLDGIARGWSNKRIAQARCRSAATVRNQMHALFRKLGVSSRSAALAAVMPQRTAH